MPDSQEANDQFVNMQSELHSKGAVLTKAWSDLFSFITKYQAELVVKENAVEMAEKEVHARKKLLGELKPATTAGTEEIVRLQEEVLTKERLLSQSKSKLFVQEQMLLRVESDLNNHKEQLDQSRSELLERQSDLIRHRSDLERLKSELTIKEEQLRNKDNLMQTLQHQLMKENAKLKEELDAKNQCLDMERRSFEAERRVHENLKQRLRDIPHSEPSNTTAPVAVGTKDSQSTLDLSVEPCDFEITNVRSVSTELPPQPMEQDYQFSDLSNLATNTSRSLSDSNASLSATCSQDLSQGSPPSKVARRTQSMKNVEMFSDSDSSHASAGETYFPLSVSQDSDSSVSEQPSNKQRKRSYKEGPMSPVSHVDTNGSVEVGAEVKVCLLRSIKSENVSAKSSAGSVNKQRSRAPVLDFYCCPVCDEDYEKRIKLDEHMHMHMHTDEKRFACEHCDYTSKRVDHLKEHVKRKHLREVPVAVGRYSCEQCDAKFKKKDSLKRHSHRKHSSSSGDKPFACQYCEYRSWRKYSLDNHVEAKHQKEQFRCGHCEFVGGDKMELMGHVVTMHGNVQNESALSGD